MFGVLIFIVVILMVFGAVRLGFVSFLHDNLTPIDFDKDKDYYRDILNKHSAFELSYIDKLKVKYDRDIVATLLNLQLKHKIKINENDISIIDSSIDDLSKTEKFIMENIKDGRLDVDSVEKVAKLSELAFLEAIKDGLVIKTPQEICDQRKRKKLIIVLTTIIIIIASFILFCNAIPEGHILSNFDTDTQFAIVATIGIVWLVLITLAIFILPLYLVVYSKLQNISYMRTDEGEEINKKLEGLKKYISDYSILKERDGDSLTEWEDYLVYSVLFGINKTGIVEDVMNLVDIKYIEFKRPDSE